MQKLLTKSLISLVVVAAAFFSVQGCKKHMEQVKAPPSAGSQVEKQSYAESDILAMRQHAKDFLLDVLLNEPPTQKFLAIQVCGDTGLQIAVPYAIDLLRTKSQIIWGKIGSVRALGQLKDPIAIPAVTEALKADDALINSEAIRALALLEGEKAKPEIVKFLDSKYAAIRLRAAASLLMLGERSASSKLLDGLGSRTPRVRVFAINYAAEIGDTSFLEDISNLFMDPEDSTREAVASALGKFKASDHRLRIAWLLENTKNLSVKTAAILALGEINAVEEVEEIRKELNNPLSAVKTSAAVTLYRLGDDSVLPMLQDILKNATTGEKKLVIKEFGKITDLHRNLPLLSEILESGDRTLMLSASESILLATKKYEK
jgi:HEAT repeat protein